MKKPIIAFADWLKRLLGAKSNIRVLSNHTTFHPEAVVRNKTVRLGNGRTLKYTTTDMRRQPAARLVATPAPSKIQLLTEHTQRLGPGVSRFKTVRLESGKVVAYKTIDPASRSMNPAAGPIILLILPR